MQFMNSTQAAISAAQISLADTLIGVSEEEGIGPPVKSYEPEYLNYRGEAAISAATSHCLQGKRVFLNKVHTLQDLAFNRLPVVCTSSRIHNWSLCLAPANAQETLEHTIAAYAITKERKVLMPACIVIDNILSHTWEPLEIPSYMTIKNLIGNFRIDKKHSLYARCDLEGTAQMHKALKNTHSLLHDFAAKWKKRARSEFKIVEKYHMDDAEFAFVIYGSATNNAKLAVRFLREHHNEKIGLLSLRLVRPFPENEVRDALQDIKRIAVVDNAFSLGTWSRLYQEVRTVHDGFAINVLSDFTSSENFIEIFSLLKQAEKPDRIWNI